MSNINLNNYEAYLLDYFEGSLTENAITELKTFSLLHPELNIELDNTDLPYFLKDEVAPDFKNNLIKNQTDFELLQSGISKNETDIINYLEGNLSETESKSVKKRLSSDNELAKDLALYEKSVLKSELEIKIENKNTLFKTEEDLVLNNLALLYTEGLLVGNEKLEFEKEIRTNLGLASELFAFEKTKIAADMSIMHPDKDSLKKEAKVIVFFTTRTVLSIAAAILLIIGLTVLFNTVDSNPEFIKQKAETKKTENVIKSEEQITKAVVSNNSEETIENLKQNLAAKVNNVKFKRVVVKNDTFIVKQKEPSQVAVNEINLKAFNDKNSKDTLLAIAVKTNSVENKQNEIEHFNKQTVLLAVEEFDNDDAVNSEEQKPKNGFWRRAVKLARQVNGLGLKAVNGDEKTNENYLISFNGFSVEKK